MYLIRNKSGFGLLETVVSLGIIAIITLGYGNVIALIGSNNKTVSTKNSATVILENVREILQNQDSWPMIRDAAENSILECARPDINISCKEEVLSQDSNGDGYNDISSGIDLYVSGGVTPYYSTKSSNYGFGYNSLPCEEFDPNLGNDKCPFRVEIDTYLNCQDPVNCHSRTLTLEGRIIYNPKSKEPIRLDIPGFLVSHNALISDQKNCEDNSGVFNLQTGKCALLVMKKACASNQMMVAIEDGVPICVDVN